MVDWVAAVLAKKEGTYGVDSVPVAATNGILIRNFRGKPLDVDRLERNLEAQTYGAQPGAATNARRTHSYEVEIAGSGDAGTAAPWMELLEACGLVAPVLVADTSATQTFAPAGALVTSLSQYDFLSDQRRKMIGSVGSFAIDFTAGAYPFFDFTWLGMVPAATPFSKTAPGAIDLTRWQDPVEVNMDNTEFLLDGYAPNLRSWRADAGVTTALRNLVGSRYIRRGNHSFKSTAVIEAPDVAVKNYIQTLNVGTRVGWEMTHGTVEGNIIPMASSKVEITDITESKEDDILMWTVGMTHTVDDGAPDFTIGAK